NNTPHIHAEGQTTEKGFPCLLRSPSLAPKSSPTDTNAIVSDIKTLILTKKPVKTPPTSSSSSMSYSVEPFNRLVKLAARAFYDDVTTKGDNQPKTGRSDNRGIAVVVLDALTRRQWIREDDLAKDLKLHSKQLRRTLRLFEEEKLITRDHRKETAKGAKMYSAAVAATVDGQVTKEGEEKVKLHTHSYCCLDYAQIYDVVRYRLHRMRTMLKDELEDKNTVQVYVCPACTKRYTALDAPSLYSATDEFFHCEKCNGILVAESDKLAAQEGGDGDDNARRRRREKLRDMLDKMEVGYFVMVFPFELVVPVKKRNSGVTKLNSGVTIDALYKKVKWLQTQLKPLMEQLTRVKDLPVPEFGNLQAWEARASAAGRAANGDYNPNDPSRSGQGYGGTPMPLPGEHRVEVAFSGVDGKEEDTKSGNGSTGLKVLPPWMIKKGMNLTKEQRGEVREEAKMDGSSSATTFTDDKKSSVETDDKTSIQDEYVKAYYTALLEQRQQEFEQRQKQQELSQTSSSNALPESPSNRQVGVKSKREEDEEDDVDWEEAPTGGKFGKPLHGVFTFHVIWVLEDAVASLSILSDSV
ncbi:hypothetical protein Tsubulata_023295, partial [Turnera subulata]